MAITRENVEYIANLARLDPKGKGFDKIAKDHYSITSNILPRNVGNVKISCVANL